MDRREFLAFTGAASIPISGCLGSPGGSTSPTSTPSTQTALDPLAGSWPTYQFDPSRTGYNPQQGTADHSRDGQWSIPYRLSSPPTVSENLVYAGSLDGFVSAIDATNGNQQWRFSPDQTDGNTWWTSPTISGERVYTQTGDAVYALDRSTGDREWEFPLNAERLRPKELAVVDDTIYLRSNQIEISALNTDDGTERWRTEYEGSGLPSGVTSPIAADQDTLYVGTVDAELIAVDTTTGEQVWTASVDKTGRIDGVALTDEYAYCTGPTVAAVDLEDGSIEWRGSSDSQSTDQSLLPIGRVKASGGPNASPPCITDELLVTTTANNGTTAFNIDTGSIRWSRQLGESENDRTPLLAAPITIGDTTYVSTERGVHVLEAASGNPRGSQFEPSGAVDTAPVIVDGVLFVGSRNENGESYLHALTGNTD